jgi:diamine N-acetyltransferase
MITIDGITIRTIAAGDLPVLMSWNDPQYRGPFQEFRFESMTALEQAFAKDGFCSDQFQMLMIEAKPAAPVGLVYLNFTREGLVRIGLVLSEQNRGIGVGSAVTAAVVNHLFANYPLVRIEAETDAENIGAQRVLEKSGFTREGVLRKYRYHHGAYRDFVMYSIVR